MDVQLPDGTVITNVPEGTTKSQLMARVQKASAPAPKSGDVGRGIAAGLGFLDTATFGLADEAGAGISAALDPFLPEGHKGGTFGERYNAYLAENRAQQNANETAHPGYSLAGKVAGGVVPAIAAGAAAPAAVASAVGKPLAARAAIAAGTGAVSGGALGFGEGEGGLGNRAESAAAGAGLGLALGPASEVVAAPIAAAGSRLIRGVTGAQAPTRIASPALQDFIDSNIPPTTGTVTGKRSVALAENMLARTPGGADVYQKAAGEQVGAAKTEATRIAQQYGDIQTPESAGEVLVKGAQDASSRFRTRQNQLYDAALKPIAGQKVAPDSLTATQKVAQTFASSLSQAPESMSGTAGKALTRVQGILDDVSKGGATIDTLRQIRTNIGREIDDPVLAGVSGAEQPYLRSVYGALSEDIGNVATKMSPQSARQLEIANRYTRTIAPQLEFLDKVIGSKAPAKVYAAAVSSAQGEGGGAKTLSAFRRNMTKEQWDTIAGTVLGRMGRAKPGAQDAEGEAFSPGTFLTNWSNLTPEAKNAIFGGSRYAQLRPQIDRLARVMEHVKNFDKMGQGSPTYPLMAQGALYGSMGTAVLSGNIPAAAAIFGSGYVAPKLAARLLTNPKFVTWLSSDAVRTAPAARAASLRSLHALAGTDATISAFLKSLSQPQQPATAN